MSSTAARDLAAEIADAHASATLAAADHNALARVEARLHPHQQKITLHRCHAQDSLDSDPLGAAREAGLPRLRARSSGGPATPLGTEELCVRHSISLPPRTRGFTEIGDKHAGLSCR